MKFCRAVLIALCAGVHCVPATGRAEGVPPDPDLPQPFDTAAYLPMLKNPPFNRVVDYTDSLLLTGVAYLEGRPMATLLDKNTKKRYVVSEQPNAQGWRLAEASVSSALHGTAIKLQVGEEIVTIRYSDEQLSPARTGTPGAGTAAGNGAPGRSKGDGVGAAAYLSQADQEFYRNGMSQAARDKFGHSMEKLQGRMSGMTEDQRAAYTQKIFTKYKAQDQPGATPPPVSPKKSKK